MITVNNKVHNFNDWTNQKEEIIRPSEKIAVEIFSYDHQYSKFLSVSDISTGFNFSKVNHMHFKCYESKDKYTNFTVEMDYEVQEIGEYRIDIYYENKDKKDYVGRWSMELNQKSAKYINTKPVQYKTVTTTKKTGKKNTKVKKKVPQASTAHRISGNDLKFDGEVNFLKRKTVFTDVKEMGKYHLSFELPYNCYFVGVSIRKIITFTGDNLDSVGTNLMLKDCEITLSGQTNPTEANFTIGYNHQFENNLTSSGYYFDFMDEVNIYVKETGLINDTKMVQRFGGYLSTVKSNDNNTTLTFSCADRLIDAENKYCLDALFIAGTTSQDLDYYKPIVFDSYAEALNFLTEVLEVKLNSNIKKNYVIEGEKYSTAVSIKFGKKKNIKKVTTKNAITTVQNNFITVRNKASGAKQQSITVYNGKDHSKKPINITNHLTFHMMYGLGDPKTESKKTDIEKTNDTSTSAGAQKFNKCGLSQDKKYIMAIGTSSAGRLDKVKGWTKTIFENKCPHCGAKNLVYDIFYGNSAGAGTAPCKGTYETGGGVEGHIFCKSCDADYSVQGWEHNGSSKFHLTRVSPIISSSKAEAQKLRNGQMSAVPKSGVSVSSDDVLKSVAQKMKKYKYVLYGNTTSSYSAMKKAGVGDCWAFSDGIFTELKKLGISCRICQYGTSLSDAHRSVVFKNAKNQWENFPYKKYGLNNMLYPTSKCNPNNYIKNFKGNNISKVTSSASNSTTTTTTVTTTTGYDREKPPQFYIEITYSTSQSWTAKKKKINLDFTLKAGTDNDWTGLSNHWINNAMRQTSVNMKGFFDDNEPGKKIYLHNIRLIAPKIKTTTTGDKAEWYTFNDSTQDFSSCKMDLYQMVFDDRMAINPTDLQSCGKTIGNLLDEIVLSSGYRVNMTYAKHRCDDKINFSINDQTEPAFVATEGDDNNILEWSNITYSPVANLRNKSVCVFKNKSGKYEYVNTADIESILRYGEQTTLITQSEQISAKEAYYMARNSTSYNPEHEYSYTIVVPFAPYLLLGDLVQVLSNSKKLNDIKTVESLKIKYSENQMPHIRTEIGLNELEPYLRIKKEQEKLRQLTRKESTVFSATATPIEDEEIYIWDN